MHSEDQIPNPETLPVAVELSGSSEISSGAPPSPRLEERVGERSPFNCDGLDSMAVETPPSAPETQTQSAENPTAGAYRGNGFVARLPKALRDQLNQMMLDGVSYPDIIERFAAQ